MRKKIVVISISVSLLLAVAFLANLTFSKVIGNFVSTGEVAAVVQSITKTNNHNMQENPSVKAEGNPASVAKEEAQQAQQPKTPDATEKTTTSHDNNHSEPSESKVLEKNVEPSSKYEAAVPEDKAIEVKENVTLKEKAKVTSILLSKLSTSEIQMFMKMSSGGLTLEEKQEAKKIILAKLSEEEYNELIAIAAKYGLSQGKKYNETQ
ncbi:hypothetical protein [Paenibacillus sp. YYML68]|uniref:hypothetical protein n=1 Tax=Paenibacillus sp. YYML68 TaxID=2909250 RepID=UPI0024913B55|nr:hypothetical protein [Paenibacillus sp. YYML68]